MSTVRTASDDNHPMINYRYVLIETRANLCETSRFYVDVLELLLYTNPFLIL